MFTLIRRRLADLSPIAVTRYDSTSLVSDLASSTTEISPKTLNPVRLNIESGCICSVNLVTGTSGVRRRNGVVSRTQTTSPETVPGPRLEQLTTSP